MQEALGERRHAYYLADLSDDAIQRSAIAVEAGRLVPGFGAASYPDWPAFLETWRARAPADAWLVMDELPYLVQVSPALPSMIARADRIPFRNGRQVHYALWLKTADVEQVGGTPVIGPAAVMAPPRRCGAAV